ncbi:MAG: glycosyltransferase [Verrucomicrobiota bacterium JB022]|nr:glycosyltransferase [Verrucomicrobiota bacterium JB022]
MAPGGKTSPESPTLRAAQKALQAKDWKRLTQLVPVLQREGRWEAAEHCLQQVLAQRADYLPAQLALAEHFLLGGRVDEAYQLTHAALALKPEHPQLLLAYARACVGCGEVEEALAAFELAESQPGPWQAQAGLGFALNLAYLPDVSAEDLRQCGAEWEARYAPPVARARPASASSRLRIGYYSPDFRRHSLAYFLPAILEGHDREAFEIYLYSDTQLPDAMTERYRGLADHWRDLTRSSDRQAVATMRRDGLDLLVDTSGFFGGCRPQLFAHRPAPVQAHLIGYNGTTGLSSLDYRFTDAVCEPPGTEAASSEKLCRLEPGFHCFCPPFETPLPALAPSVTAGHVTFGCFNHLTKLNDEVIALWAELLQRQPTSRLLLKAINLTNESTREGLRARFQAHGVDPARIETLPGTPSQGDHLAAYARVDIALDPFPCNGTTTTLEALWMGVPVLTLPGERHSARVSASLLQQIGLSECVATDRPDFFARAQKLADDATTRTAWRHELRQRIQRAPLGDPAQFVPRLEAAYHEMRRAAVE